MQLGSDFAKTRCGGVDRTLVKDGNVWRRSGRKYDSGIICKSSHCKSHLTIKYLNNLYGQLDEQSMPVLRGAWNVQLSLAGIPDKADLLTFSDVREEDGNRQQRTWIPVR